jgi:hypothetical protein
MGMEAGMDAGSLKLEAGKNTYLSQTSHSSSIQPLASSFFTSIHNLKSASSSLSKYELRQQQTSFVRNQLHQQK